MNEELEQRVAALEEKMKLLAPGKCAEHEHDWSAWKEWEYMKRRWRYCKRKGCDEEQYCGPSHCFNRLEPNAPARCVVCGFQ
jgi:hypothetical protein